MYLYGVKSDVCEAHSTLSFLLSWSLMFNPYISTADTFVYTVHEPFGGAMPRVVLTDFILLQVIEFLDVPTLLNLRLLNRSINGLISCYESSIAKRMARSLCPEGHEDRLVKSIPFALGEVGYFVRLNLAHKLATIAVASNLVPRVSEPPLRGISPDDDLGNGIRQKVTNGFMTISEVSRIHKDVTLSKSARICTRQRRQMGLSRFFSGLTSAQRATEKEILRHWLEYMDALPVEDIIDFNIALWCLRGKLTFDHRLTEENAALWNNVLADAEVEAIQWTTFHLARKGLHCIGRLWSVDQLVAQKAQGDIHADMQQRSSKLIHTELSTFSELLRGCRREIRNTPSSVLFRYSNNEADIYCESTFGCRTGPVSNGMSSD